MKDLLLTSDGDLFISESGDVSITDSVRQAIKVRLSWFFSEWRFGPEIGIPYYEEIFVKNPNGLKINQVIRDEILTVEEVDDVRDVTFFLDPKTRKASIAFLAVVGEEIFREEVLIGV